MTWMLLWLYIFGCVNEFFFASHLEVDMKRWQSHVLIALWPITIPISIVVTLYELLTEDGDKL